MFDTMTTVKAFSSVCGALLILLLGGWAASAIYTTPKHHGDDHHYAYVIEPEEGSGEAVAVEEGPTFEEAFAMADASAGATLFTRGCAGCHAMDAGDNGIGPYLHAVVGRDVAAAEGFSYSGALIAVNDVWTAEELNAFIEKPGDYAPGTAMSYPGMRDVEDRANLIAYLASGN